MNGECVVCFNSLMEAAPAPPLAAGSAEVDGTLAVDTASLLKRAKKSTIPTLEESTSLNDIFATPCGHVFHAQCLKQLFAPVGRIPEHNLEAPCPSCKKPVTKTSLIQLFIGVGLHGHGPTPTSSAGPSTSNAPSESSSSAAANSSGPLMTSSPGPSGNQKRHADETLDIASTVEEQGNDDDFQVLHNFLIQEYSGILHHLEALELDEEMLETKFPSAQPNEHASNTGSNVTQDLGHSGLQGMKVEQELELRQNQQQGASKPTPTVPQGQEKSVYTCNTCKNPVESRFHCLVCDDFNQCVGCYQKCGHPHKMQKLGFGPAQKQEARRLAIQRCVQNLVHASQCLDATCSLPSCLKMKQVIAHAKACKRKTNGGCPICKQLIALCCYHAKVCQERGCPVPFCSNIKQKLRQQEAHKRLQQNQLLRRRVQQMAAMSAQQNAPMGHRQRMRQLPGTASHGQLIQGPQQQQQVVGRNAQRPQQQFVPYQQANQLGNFGGAGNLLMGQIASNLINAGTGNQMNAAMLNQLQPQMPMGQLVNPNVNQLGYQLNNPTLQPLLQQLEPAVPGTSPSQTCPPP